MTTTQLSTVLPALRAADSGFSGYLEAVTAVDDYLKAAKTSQAKIARGQRITKEGQDEFAEACFHLNQAGVTIAQLHRDTGVSESHLRNIIKIWALTHAPAAK